MPEKMKTVNAPGGPLIPIEPPIEALVDNEISGQIVDPIYEYSNPNSPQRIALAQVSLKLK